MASFHLLVSQDHKKLQDDQPLLYSTQGKAEKWKSKNLAQPQKSVF